MSRRSPLLILCVVCLGLFACAKEEIQTYKVAKEKPKSMSQGQMPSMNGEMPANHPPMQGQLPDGHPPTAGKLPDGHPPISSDKASPSTPQAAPQASANDLVWTAPASWQTKPLGQMRRGSFGLKGSNGTESDLSIFVFPGAAGGVVENINRWRGQIGLGPIAPAALADESTPLRSDSGLDLLLVDLKGSGADSILGAILTQQGQSWFFKLKGPTGLLQEQKADFVAFLKTVKTP